MTYKLTYFDCAALGEPLRFLLKYGNIDFEDVRIKNEDWPQLKPTLPMGTLPLLEVDGKKMYQSISILRLLAKKLGLSGSTDLENFEIDQIVDTVVDLREKIGGFFFDFDLDELLKAKKLKTYNEQILPFYLEKLEAIAKQNNGHLALNRLTWADLYFTSTIEYVISLSKQKIKKYPNLTKVTDNVYALENIKKWVDTRPISDF